MPKMTTEQFLSQLGIEVEQEFRIDKYIHKYRFNKDMRLECKFWNEDWHLSNSRFDEVIGHEITPLPKYTLSEDEKAIVRNIDGYYLGSLLVLRKCDGYLYFATISEKVLRTNGRIPFANLFKFIKENEAVSLDELRKCL